MRLLFKVMLNGASCPTFIGKINRFGFDCQQFCNPITIDLELHLETESLFGASTLDLKGAVNQVIAFPDKYYLVGTYISQHHWSRLQHHCHRSNSYQYAQGYC